MISEKDLVDGCKAYNRVAQKLLYSEYSGKMYAVCVRYLKDKEEAKDLLQEGFVKVFSNIDKYSSKGSLEGWIRRVMINVALNYIREKRKLKLDSIESYKDGREGAYQNDKNFHSDLNSDFEIEEGEFSKADLDKALNEVPEVYRLVFNLYHIDEFSHTEIARMLSIDESTSRSRLFRAKKTLKEYLLKLREIKNTKVKL